ncbi:hypothetical protein PLICRDRAFT_364162 [Plicaturopsis crispa FD-325 SS-3]|uniref:Large ribosomal subunit protein uL30m n=1 Tax=Plicaturopsis crispa FD-325 SS-3 TaxID=944288 RepID=A0A0C9T4Y3_PLICR|nr:hypothetical protein PLICRDRAFT_364162 [Plicaturopsis crispa FD-325 SS-3]
MASTLSRRCTSGIIAPSKRRLLATSVSQSQTSTASSSSAPPPNLSQSQTNPEPNTHYKITLRRSAIALAAPVKATLVALGIHRRMQTVYHAHSPAAAGMILRVKELVEVENVPTSGVRTKEEMTRERRPPRGYAVKGQRALDI